MTNDNSQNNPFDDFFQQNLKPLLEEEGRNRDAFRSRFWLYFGVLCFVNSVNILVVLFRHLISGHIISYEQLLLLVAFSVLFLWWYARRAKTIPQTDMLREYIKYYDNLQLQEENVFAEKDILFPVKEDLVEQLKISGNFLQFSFELKKIALLKNKTKQNEIVKNSGGIMLSYSFKQNLRGTLLMFEKGGVVKQKKYEGLEKISLNIPASNYFQIFTDSSKIKNYILVSALFESILDLKEIFKAAKVNLRIKDNQLIIFLQNGKLSYQQSSAWHSVASEKDFENLNLQMEKAETLGEIVGNLYDLAES